MPHNKQPIIRAWDAYISPTERIPLKDADGRIAASTIRQYPPGIPDILPSMIYSKDIIDKIKSANMSGVDLIGIDMSADQLVDVVLNNKDDKYDVEIRTFESQDISNQTAIEIADFFRTGFCAAPYFHFAFHESDPFQSLPPTLDFEAYAVSVALPDKLKRQACQNTLREIAIQRAKKQQTLDLAEVYLPEGFHLWTDKNICRKRIKNRLLDPGYVTLVRDKRTTQILGLLHARMASIERLFQTEEWSDPLLFSAYDDPDLRDDPNRFYEKVKFHFGLNPYDEIMTISAQILAPKIQGGDVFYNMMRSMAVRVRPDHARLPVLSEIPLFGTAHTVNTALNDRIIYGVLKNEHPVVFSSQFAQGLFPLIQEKRHWQFLLRKAAKEQVDFRKNYFISSKTDNQNVKVRPNGKLGLAVFATSNIPAGTRIAIFEGETYRSDTALSLPSIMRDHAIQIGANEYVFGRKGLAHCICHSCDPNCGVRGLTEIFAVKDIREDEQITWDYRCSENSNWVLETCLCGSARCTGSVRNYDSLPNKIKAEYLSKNMVSDWLTASKLI